MDGTSAEHEIVLGSARAMVIQVARVQDEGESMLDMFDCLNADTFDMYEALWSARRQTWKESVRRMIDENRRLP